MRAQDHRNSGSFEIISRRGPSQNRTPKFQHPGTILVHYNTVNFPPGLVYPFTQHANGIQIPGHAQSFIYFPNFASLTSNAATK